MEGFDRLIFCLKYLKASGRGKKLKYLAAALWRMQRYHRRMWSYLKRTTPEI